MVCLAPADRVLNDPHVESRDDGHHVRAETVRRDRVALASHGAQILDSRQHRTAAGSAELGRPSRNPDRVVELTCRHVGLKRRYRAVVGADAPIYSAA